MTVWEPTDEAQIKAAIADGNLKENRHLDVKREIGDSDGKRRELARDLASFAIDGGALLIGVEEQDDKSLHVRPFALADQAERVEQIATNRVDPPLFVSVRDIPSDEGGTGYLWVEVPPSPLAPHMVDNVYWARADRTKTKLTDADVVRLHSRRESVEDRVRDLLDAEIARDPVPDAKRSSGHLWLVAWPINARKDLAVEWISSNDPSHGPFALAHGAEDVLTRNTREFAPSPGYASNQQRRSQGVAFTTLEPGRRFPDDAKPRDEEHTLDIEFREDGGLRVLIGRMTAEWSDRGAVGIVDGIAVAYVRRLIRWAELLGDQCGYRGTWGFGIAADGMRGLMSTVYWGHLRFGNGPTYDADTYREVTTASRQEIAAQPWAVAERLLGRLLRSLGTSAHYGADITAPE